MLFTRFFALRLFLNPSQSISRLVVGLAIASIALGVAVMEISIGVVNGFESAIQEKIIGFGSHLKVYPIGEEEQDSVSPIQLSQDLLNPLWEVSRVKGVYPVMNTYALLQSSTGLDGISLKGVADTGSFTFFKPLIIEGNSPDLSPKEGPCPILISKKQSLRLSLKVGDKAKLYFLTEPPKIRPIIISGIYESGLGEFDAVQVLAPIYLTRKLFHLSDEECSALEIRLNNMEDLPKITDQIRTQLPYYLEVNSIEDLYPEMFAWLQLQHQNVDFILLLMVAIAIINMCSVLLILILERTRTIGLLKALGANSFQLLNIFLWQGGFMIGTGLALGNILGLGLLLIQNYTGWMKLDQENYFLTEVPVAWPWETFGWINLSLLVICLLFLLIPARLIFNIKIVTALRFD